MSRLVRVVGVADADERTVAARTSSLAAGTEASIVATRGGVLVTLGRRYGPGPGARRRAIAALQAELVRVLGG